MAEQNQTQLKQNLKDSNQWIRIVYMVLFWIVLYFAMMVTGVLIFIQILFVLITGSENANLREFSADLIKYINQILSFLTYNEQRKPFPFASWGELEQQAPIEAEAEVETDESQAVSNDETDNDKPST